MSIIMAVKNQKLNKKARRELAKKRAKMKKLIIIVSAVVIVLGVAAFIYFSTTAAAGTETYTDGYQTVTLRPNGRFSANLYHDEKYTGTYTIEDQGSWSIVAFVVNNQTIYGTIIQDNLMLPDDWHDDHGHNTVLQKKN